jgi:acyl dehydratase
MLKWNEIEEGMHCQPFVDEPVTRTDIVRYQGASGDFDAAHHDDEHARRFGFRGVFSLGMLHGGILASYACGLFGLENIRRYRLRFRDIIWPGDTLTYIARVVRKYEESGERRIDLELSCQRSEVDVPIRAEATFVVVA